MPQRYRPSRFPETGDGRGCRGRGCGGRGPIDARYGRAVRESERLSEANSIRQAARSGLGSFSHRARQADRLSGRRSAIYRHADRRNRCRTSLSGRRWSALALGRFQPPTCARSIGQGRRRRNLSKSARSGSPVRAGIRDPGQVSRGIAKPAARPPRFPRSELPGPLSDGNGDLRRWKFAGASHSRSVLAVYSLGSAQFELSGHCIELHGQESRQRTGRSDDHRPS